MSQQGYQDICDEIDEVIKILEVKNKRIAELEEYKNYMLEVAKNHDCDSITQLASKCTRLEKRIADLEKGLELAIPILNSAYKQHWDGAFNAWDICNNLAKGGDL